MVGPRQHESRSCSTSWSKRTNSLSGHEGIRVRRRSRSLEDLAVDATSRPSKGRSVSRKRAPEMDKQLRRSSKGKVSGRTLRDSSDLASLGRQKRTLQLLQTCWSDEMGGRGDGCEAQGVDLTREAAARPCHESGCPPTILLLSSEQVFSLEEEHGRHRSLKVEKDDGERQGKKSTAVREGGKDSLTIFKVASERESKRITRRSDLERISIPDRGWRLVVDAHPVLRPPDKNVSLRGLFGPSRQRGTYRVPFM